MQIKIDELDKKILALLAKNGRMSNAEIARMVGAGERTVNNRVNNLIDSGVVHIIGVINAKAFGYKVMADVLCEVEAARIEAVAHEIALLPETRYVAISFGEHNVSAQVESKSTQDLYRFVAQKLSKISGIQKVTTVIIPEIIKDIEDWVPVELLAEGNN